MFARLLLAVLVAICLQRLLVQLHLERLIDLIFVDIDHRHDHDCDKNIDCPRPKAEGTAPKGRAELERSAIKNARLQMAGYREGDDEEQAIGDDRRGHSEAACAPRP